ncbi:MAG: hypothetical protein H0U57_07370 [Tatlockia sp.]|nr:hypothetical protein [Tatlockia sp.]
MSKFYYLENILSYAQAAYASAEFTQDENRPGSGKLPRLSKNSVSWEHHISKLNDKSQYSTESDLNYLARYARKVFDAAVYKRKENILVDEEFFSESLFHLKTICAKSLPNFSYPFPRSFENALQNNKEVNSELEIKEKVTLPANDNTEVKIIEVDKLIESSLSTIEILNTESSCGNEKIVETKDEDNKNPLLIPKANNPLEKDLGKSNQFFQPAKETVVWDIDKPTIGMIILAVCIPVIGWAYLGYLLFNLISDWISSDKDQKSQNLVI